MYLTNYATTGLGLSQTSVLVIDAIGGAASAATTALAARWSDRIGRRRLTLWACGVLVVWSLLLIPLMNIGSTTAVGVGIVGMLGLVGLAYGPLGAYLPELFATRYRYTGAGLTYNLGGVTGGTVVLVVAAPLAASA